MSDNQNLDKIFKRTFAYAKKLAKEFYFSGWAKNQPKCPAFKGETIHIGREGWEHTVKTIRRTRMDVLGRLFCLEKARHLLEMSSTFQDYRKIKDLEFWVFESVIGDTKIKVVLRSIKDGPKHFYSVIRKGSVDEEIDRE